MAKKHVWSDDDESSILEEVGGEPEDPENPNSAVMVNEDKIRELGAVNAESVRSNRRNETVVARKRAGEKNVPFNEPDVLLRFDQAVKVWGHNTFTILVARLGIPGADAITTQPKNSIELLAELKKMHGRQPETTYELFFQDVVKKEKRGTGRITLPGVDESPSPTQVQPPVGQQAPQQPVVQVMPSPPVPQQQQPDAFETMKKAYEMIRMLQQPQQQQAPVQQQMPPMPQSQDPSVNTMMQMMEMMRMMQPPPQPAPQMQQPVVIQPPPAAPPPVQQGPDVTSMMMAMMQKMFETMLTKQVQPPMPAPVPVEDYGPRGPYRGPRPQGYGPRPQQTYERPYDGRPYDGRQTYDRPYEGRPPYDGRPYDGYGPSPSPPARPKSAVEEFRDATSVIRTAINIADEFGRSEQPQQQPQQQASDPDDDNPLKVIDVGGNRVLVNKEDGSFRAWETGFANMDKILKFAGDQFEKLQKNAVANQQAKQQQQQLPPGYVEVTPGYQPPPGYVAVPVDQIPQSALPPPPANLPPPINEPSEEQRPPWGMPPIPEGQ